MKVDIVYESKYGNGKKCVEHLQNIINKKGHDTKLFSIRDIKPDNLPQADFYIFSSPTHIGAPPQKMKKFLKNLEIQNKGVNYALMTTYLNPEAKTLQIMEELLQSTGMTKTTEGLKIKVTGMKGPPEKDYEKKIESFATDLFGKK